METPTILRHVVPAYLEHRSISERLEPRSMSSIMKSSNIHEFPAHALHPKYLRCLTHRGWSSSWLKRSLQAFPNAMLFLPIPVALASFRHYYNKNILTLAPCETGRGTPDRATSGYVGRRLTTREVCVTRRRSLTRDTSAGAGGGDLSFRLR